MAIFAPNHRPVGRSTHAAGTAGAHVHYITRAGAASLLMGEHMPVGRDAREWIDQRELTDRKNGRVIDKLMLPLPIELDAEQRADLVRDFMQNIGGGRVSWLAAFHDRGADAHNPHAHVVLRDKDHETGKRVFGTSEKGSTDRIRELWETAINQALEREGFDVRVDRRSLAEQGIDRQPGIHVGPNVYQMEERGVRPVSVALETETGRVINWPEIDQGRTRAEYQREIEQGNIEAQRDRGKAGEKQIDLVPAAVIEIEPEPVNQAELVDEVELGRKIPSWDPEQDFRAPDPPEIQPVTPAPAMLPEERRRQWAAELRGMAAESNRVPEPTRQQEAGWAFLGGMEVPANQPEVTQRPSYEVEKPDFQAAPALPVVKPALQAERSRLAEWIITARERLADLGTRLETALDRMMQRRPEPRPTSKGKTMDDNAAVILQAMKQPERDIADELLAAGRARQQRKAMKPPEIAPEVTLRKQIEATKWRGLETGEDIKPRLLELRMRHRDITDADGG